MLTNTNNRDRTPNQEDDSWSDSQQETDSSFKHFKSEEAQSLDNCSSFKESCPTKKSIGLGEEKEKQDYLNTLCHFHSNCEGNDNGQ